MGFVVDLVHSASGTLAAGVGLSAYRFVDGVACMAGSSRRRGTVRFTLALLLVAEVRRWQRHLLRRRNRDRRHPGLFRARRTASIGALALWALFVASGLAGSSSLQRLLKRVVFSWRWRKRRFLRAISAFGGLFAAFVQSVAGRGITEVCLASCRQAMVLDISICSEDRHKARNCMFSMGLRIRSVGRNTKCKSTLPSRHAGTP